MAYTFDPLFAADPNNPATVAANASITLFDPADVTQAPVTITDVTGAPLTNPVTVNKNGFGPAFQHATLDRLGWFGAGFTGYFTSFEGIKAAAVAAQNAAETAGNDAAAAAAAGVAGVAADADAAAAAAAASATAAANSAALVGAPADTAIAAAVNGTGTATRTALNATYDQSALSMHWARHADIKRRKGGVIGTNGKSVIAFQIAHQLDPFKATIFEEFRKRGLPVGWGAVTGAVGDPADSYEPTTATWADVKKHFYEGAEVWAHSRTHLEPKPIGTDGGDTIQGEIQGAREDIEAQGLYAMGWQTAGVYPQALTPYYNDFMGPTSEDMTGWKSEVGQRLLANYGLISLISAGGKRFLPTNGSEGLGYWTFDNQTYTTTKAQIDILKDRPGHGLVLAMHPKNIGLNGMMSFADLTATLDYVKQLWDAGTVEVVTQSGMAFADPGTSRRLNLLVDSSFDGGTTTASWGLVGGALRETSGGRTGSNFLRLPSGTGAYATQGPGANLRTWGGHGMVFMFDGWARNNDAVNSVGARVQIYANTPGGNVTLRDVTTTLAASAPWTRIRMPVGVPKDATNVVVQLMRSGLGTVDYDDVNIYAC